ncbi:hypothetical protein BH09MYX1_BH09MYX1_17060 [soil metagenome]
MLGVAVGGDEVVEQSRLRAYVHRGAMNANVARRSDEKSGLAGKRRRWGKRKRNYGRIGARRRGQRPSEDAEQAKRAERVVHSSLLVLAHAIRHRIALARRQPPSFPAPIICLSRSSSVVPVGAGAGAPASPPPPII